MSAFVAPGCSDSSSTHAGTGGAATGGISGTGGGAAGSAGTGGAAGAGGAPGIPLTTWVDDLVQNQSTEISAPDTVDDKNIVDTSDPAAFDPLLNR